MKRKDLQMTYEVNEAGLKQALADLADATAHPSGGDAFASLDELPEIPAAGEETVAQFIPKKPTP